MFDVLHFYTKRKMFFRNKSLLKCFDMTAMFLLFLFFYSVKCVRDSGILLVKEPSDIVVVPGDSVLLDCMARAEDGSDIDIKWRASDGQYLSAQIDDQHRKQLSNGSLLLSNVFLGEVVTTSGGLEQYQCIASSDKFGSIVSRTASVTVARLPPFEKQPVDLHVYTGQTAYFSCIVDARPPAKVVWFKNRYPLVLDSSRMLILPSGSLEIDDVKMSDAGNYHCNVSSMIGERLSERAELTVKSAYDAESSRMAPIFVASPRSSVIVEGGNITLECAANGFPRPNIVWLKDGATIDLAFLDSRFSIIGTGSLQIVKVEEGDRGNYVCRAENKEDSTDATATLEVQVPPRFIHKPTSKFAHEKEDIELPCEVYGKPEPKVMWLKNGEVITLNEYLQVVHRNNLRILGSMSLDSGIFQCVASNPAGNIQVAAKLTVLKSDQQLPSNLTNQDNDGSSSLPPVSPSLSGDKQKPKHRGGPPAARNLKAAVVSKRFIVLSWQPAESPSSEIDSYSVYYHEKDSLRERIVNITKSSQEEVNITGLLPGRTYEFRVVALSSDRMSESSETISVTTQGELHVASAPIRVTGIVLSSTSILVQWQPPHISNGPIIKYQLFYIEDDVGVERYIETAELKYELTGLSNFTAYTIWVVAHDSNGPGANSDELHLRTYSNVPSKPPQNVTLEVLSSTSVVVRWEPPPRDGQNGIITGYKLRYKKGERKGRGETVTTAGDRRMYPLEGLDRNSAYQIRLWALNVNGTGPPTDWYPVETFENDLIETTVPDPPGTLLARPLSNSIIINWTPPEDTSIMIRSYTVGWGKGVPDMYSKSLNGKHSNSFVIPNLVPNSEYVISVRASNELGDGPPRYTTVRTMSETYSESTAPLSPPIGLKASILSATSAVLYWTDTTLPQGQFVTDDRYYVVRCTLYHPTSPANSRPRFYNATDVNLIISDLKPNTQYEFTVKLVKGRRESLWSMVVLNTTFEDLPSSPPMDLTAVSVEGNPTSVNLNWQPPRTPNGKITGYLVHFTSDTFNSVSRDAHWNQEKVIGDKMSTTIKNLSPNTTYFFKIQAKTKRGDGPMSNPVSFTTYSSMGQHPVDPGSIIKDNKDSLKSSTLLYIGIGCGALTILCIGIIVSIICCKKNGNLDSSKKEYMKAGVSSKNKAQSTSIKPPDLWIHHDQMELKAMEKSSQGSLDTASGGGPSSNNLSRDFDVPDHHHETRVHHHTPTVTTNSLDKRTYISSYVGSPSEQPLLYEEKISTLRRAPKNKPISLHMDRLSPCSNSSSDIIESQPLYPRPHYSISRAHVTVDPSGSAENAYIIQSTVGNFEPVSNSSSSQLPSTPIQGQNYGSNVEAKRLQGHPLKSFSVPAPPPQSAPSTPQQKHVVRPQGSSSPYKKVVQAPSATATPPANPTGSKPWQSDLLQLSKIQPSYSTEELNQEMANLEGLMKDLNAITASEFEC